MMKVFERINKRSLIVFATLLYISACGGNQRILDSANRRAEAEKTPSIVIPPKLSSFEEDLQAMRNADFTFIYVFRRKDGGVFDREDRRFVADITPVEINRRRVADNGEWIILGSNFRMPEDAMKLLKERFVFEDHSKRLDELPANADTNSNS